ncbi:hypothetical protein KC19_12G074500 [Ceratodon purpureus]|uniref:Chitin-binding type-1 domain-containing protein n=1 Tax=Ceratodon purpureus TaxID=3225 RepID=A0A8T0G6X2_CERPU|nr:hypothetical protein KC19_12G074500 [Ceratodon purpureus]
MTRGGLHHTDVAALVAMAALLLFMQGASAQGTDCSAIKPCADPSNCCSQYGYCGISPGHCGAGCQNGPCTGSTTPAPPAGGSGGWSSFVTKAVFESFFPDRVAFYTYEGLQAASVAPYAAFGTTGSLDDQKRELAAFLANVNQESGGLQFTVEQSPVGIYCQADNTQYPCAPGKTYIGRGPIQLSWNYNYGACGAALGKDLLANPDQVAQDSATAYQTALWFWMTQGPHDAILKGSFSGTIQAINGNLECGKLAGTEAHNKMLNRVQYYKSFCQTLSVDPGADLEC